MITEFSNGFYSVFSFYFLGKLFGTAIILLAILVLLSIFVSTDSSLEDDKNENNFQR